MTPQSAPQPFAQLMQILMGKWTALAVSAVARLGVADHVSDVPVSASDIAAKIGAKPELLYRLMRATASVGVFAEKDGKKFVQTEMSALLRDDNAPRLKYFATLLSDEWDMRGWELLAETVRTGERPLEKLFGQKAFEYFAKHPAQGETFHRGMTDGSTMDGPMIAEVYDFSGIPHLTDVGGGHGLLISTILQRYPQMTGTLFDAAEVIESAATGPASPVLDRLKLVSGDMFKSVPSGADAYMMKYIIHDWPDELCIRLLKNCAAGLRERGRLLVIDSVLPGPGEFHPGKVIDLEMMLFPGGKERTAEEFRDLFAAAGWKLTRIIPTPSTLSIAEGVLA